ncbi:Thaumatin [Corchorus capsularis]|uniref:Thaumatin n=1 Tax=Corchorus capsularis TaxID=210143 RepID=A0A1R3IGX4_COCAP|nr:Thaumatin [Corchorus capsularis]
MATLTIKNNCPYTIWPATQTGGGKPQLGKTGFSLASHGKNSINVPATWSGRVWARTGCSTNSGRFVCATADCGSGQVACHGRGGAPPATLAEFTLEGKGGHDTYDISNVDGFNLPLSITPQGGSGPKCTRISCSANINLVCPSQLAVKGSGGNIIGCKSACAAFGKPQYCCTGEYMPRGKCPPTNYSKFFKKQCPQAYSYAQDDSSSTFGCNGGPNYLITFCP